MPYIREGQRWPWFFAAWALGVACHLQQKTLWPVTTSLAVLMLALVAAWRWQGWPGRVLAVWALSWALAAGHAARMPAALDPALEGRDLDMTGQVLEMTQAHAQGLRFRFGVEQARLGEQTVQVPPSLMLSWYADARPAQEPEVLPVLQPGERWRLRVRLKAAHGLINPGGFDHELRLWTQGIRATGYVRQGRQDPVPERLGQSGHAPLEWARQQVRDRLLARRQVQPVPEPVEDAAAPDPAVAQADLPGILAALVTGDQAAIERSDWDVFRITGVAHLMSISGVHVTMLGWLAGRWLAWLWRHSALWGRRWPLYWPAPQVGAWGGLAVAVLYAAFSGWGVPAQRTVWMLACVTLLRQSARRWPGPMVWALAALVVLTLDPWAGLQAGFWLSFVAVGVLMATAAPEAPVWGGRPDVVHPAPHQRGDSLRMLLRLEKPLRGLRQLWREQAVVSLALAPIGLLFFGQVSLVGLLANLVAIPWVTTVVTPLALAGVLLPGAWDLASLALQPLLALLQEMASWPAASLRLPMPPWPLALLATAGGVLLFMPWPKAWRIWGVLWLLPALLWRPERPPQGEFELLAADIGQGNAVLVRTAGHSLLYDTGPRYGPDSDAGDRVLVPLLAQGAESLDVLMVSHSDTDHTGGARAVLATQPQARLWASLAPSHPLWRLRDGLFCRAGLAWTWDGVRFEVLYPSATAQAQARKPNAATCVLRIQGRGGSALLTGDIEQAQERVLLAQGLTPVDWLLVPHHGSKTSSGEAFLQALQPRVAVVQAGYRNRYGHPAGPVLERYQGMGLQWVDSVHCGAMRWGSDRPAQWQCERERVRRYWHHHLPEADKPPPSAPGSADP